MDALSLPLGSISDSVETALGKLNKANRAGLVIDLGQNQFGMVKAHDLLDVKVRNRKLSDLRRSGKIEPVLLMTPRVARLKKLDLIKPTRTQVGYQKFLDSKKHDYAIFGITTESAMVVTSSEKHRDYFMISGGYRCTGETTHRFPPPRVELGERCPKPNCSGVIKPAL